MKPEVSRCNFCILLRLQNIECYASKMQFPRAAFEAVTHTAGEILLSKVCTQKGSKKVALIFDIK